MTAAHEISAEREPINIAEKRQQYFDVSIDLISPFLERIILYILYIYFIY